MSEEQTNGKSLKKPGRPRKTVTTADTNKSILENILTEEKFSLSQAHEELIIKSAKEKESRTKRTSHKTPPPRKKTSEAATKNEMNNTIEDTISVVDKKSPAKRSRKTKTVVENVPEDAFQDTATQTPFQTENTRANDNINHNGTIGQKKPKASTRFKQNTSVSAEDITPPKFKYVPTEHFLDLGKEKQTQDVDRPKRKPGRPIKKAATQPVLSLIDSGRLPLTENEKLAIESKNKLAIEAHDKLAIQAHDKLSLLSHGRQILGAGSKNALEENHAVTLPVPIYDEYFIETNKTNDTAQDKKTKRTTAGRNFKSRQKNTHEQQNSTFDEDSNHAKFTDMKVADFVVGVHGTSAYGGSNSLGEYGEKAALGVMGIIDEAPSVEALLPFVIDSESERESKSSRRSRLRKRSRDKTAKQPPSVDPKVEYEFETPIAEGGELSLLEAEATIRKHNKKKEIVAKAEDVSRVLYVSSVPDEQVEVVITENGVVSEYFVEMSHQAKIRGNIYKGIINNVDTNLQAAFVNFGCGKNGFLQIDEVHPEYWLTHHTEGGKYPPIQKVLKVGQEVLVQVVKEPSGSKGAFLTTWISLAGRFIVLTPGQEQIGVSRKVEDNVERSRLRDLLTGINPGENMGVIIRTASEGASKSNIQNDLKYLKRAWKEIQKKVVIQDAPSLIYQEADLASRAVRDYLSEDIDELWVDSESVYDALKDLVSVVFPKNQTILKIHKDTRHTLWERFNILRQLEEVTKREVVLPSGGRLVFDQTEALMAIDINSGKTQGKSNFESMVFRTNMEATEAIARHLRLRDIGGQVVIDFIEMRDRGHCRDIEKAMRNAMKKDKARHDVGRLSSFGLLELVRQRTGTSAISISSEPCPHCRGTGFRRNLEWQAQGVLREIKSKLSGKNVPTSYIHHVEHEIAFYLLNKKRDRLSELENKFNIKIEIHVK